jgi:hypothetical protein
MVLKLLAVSDDECRDLHGRLSALIEFGGRIGWVLLFYIVCEFY